MLHCSIRISAPSRPFHGRRRCGEATEMTKSSHALCAASMLVLMAASGPAQAASPTAKDILSSFNLVTTGNVSTQSDIVGDAVIGGNLSGATFLAAAPTFRPRRTF